MRTLDLITSAIGNTFRSKTRTTLTVLAIFVGAFTLTITQGLGTGINRYIDDTVSGIGASDVMTVTKTPDSVSNPFDSGPQEYDPDAVSSGQNGIPGMTTTALTQDDLDAIADVDGVLRVKPVESISVDFVQYGDGTRYTASVGSFVAGQELQLAAGAQPDSDSTDYQIAIPDSYVKPLGFASNGEAIGSTLIIALTDGQYTQQTVEAEIVGVSEETLSGPSGSSFVPNDALTSELAAVQATGLPADQQDRWAQASAWFDPDATDAQITALKDRLADAGYTGTTIADQLGAFTTVIDAIVLVLNAFAVIALLAAAFGIVNTLLMSVQERTREIGLMKAMGMGSGRVFSLFSLEAVFIGFLGSAIGAGIAILVGTGLSQALGGALLSDLPGLTLFAFDPANIVTTIVVIMLIAFLAGTLPAWKAARQDPVESLRYE